MLPLALLFGLLLVFILQDDGLYDRVDVAELLGLVVARLGELGRPFVHMGEAILSLEGILQSE